MAAAMVMVFHGAGMLVPHPGFASLGQTGIDLFFVLSGFLITSILLKAAPGDWGEVRTFYVRRSLRIFPLYFGYLFLLVLTHRTVSWPYWCYLANYFPWAPPAMAGPEHFWSLGVEEQFYLVWPFLVLFAPRRLLLPILWSLIFSAGCLRLLLVARHHEVYYFTFTRMDGLAAGAVLAVFFAQRPLAAYRRSLVTGLLFFSMMSGVLGVFFGREHIVWFAMLKYWSLSGMYTLLLAVILASPASHLWVPLRARPVRWMGRISYGLYVFHPAIFRLVFRQPVLHTALLRFVAGTACTFVVASLSWYLYERNFLRLKDRLAPEPRFVPEASIAG